MSQWTPMVHLKMEPPEYRRTALSEYTHCPPTPKAEGESPTPEVRMWGRGVELSQHTPCPCNAPPPPPGCSGGGGGWHKASVSDRYPGGIALNFFTCPNPYTKGCDCRALTRTDRQGTAAFLSSRPLPRQGLGHRNGSCKLHIGAARERQGLRVRNGGPSWGRTAPRSTAPAALPRCQTRVEGCRTVLGRCLKGGAGPEHTSPWTVNAPWTLFFGLAALLPTIKLWAGGGGGTPTRSRTRFRSGNAGPPPSAWQRRCALRKAEGHGAREAQVM